ncbi:MULTISPECIES: nucleotide pyrophosphatase/phosphodiesterase family protein [unclassified Sphingopyxis]|uniref:nucleotide pyrophosphatase/phosphodiesterase family protein n=1 Tax=unclassified Sphingopyxis TaxID=2614943 RepID=UPI000731B853|nr:MULTISPECIES: nucleotide pyrophosphatase/phosphodiesterase family protein [unclassified Sphingopyxis]KTE23305.1 phosphodiesterase [Sphingopyxis sp. H057]KTE51958.1 phosphodiesterase [Sphingopyxis sp. H073]KTE52346.1 phosphodiesterase [Sphingopyxis sp. H071]KTE53344.1 phosphodiesterase [Sphingopyxis sp. H107]KTE64664.1 phosphodiesterase [Sphingopyxis sp. H100]
MTRFLSLLLLLFVAAPVVAQETRKPVTILISIDGFRADYRERGITPTLSKLAAEGAHGALRPSFPTKTFPNHYAIVTGKRPDNNGITGNNMIDPRRPAVKFSLSDPKQSLDPFWWDEAEPAWVTANKAGVRTATMFWPGSEVAIHEIRPPDWLRYDENVGYAQRVNTILDWMRRPADIRPAFVTLYFEAVDSAGHEFGPDSAEVNAAIAEVDARIGDLVAGLAAMGQPAQLLVVADHGMRAIDESRVIQLADLIDLPSIIAVETGPYAAIEPAAGTDNRVYDALLKPHDHMTCNRREELPERLHYGKNPRVAAIICIAEPGWSILAGPPQWPVKGGAHGYDNQDLQMLALFVASGTPLKGDVGIVDNIEVYPLLMRLIGVAPIPGDASGALVKRLPR